jgi:fucose 4-O-acetylase-like acetyltransferase
MLNRQEFITYYNIAELPIDQSGFVLYLMISSLIFICLAYLNSNSKGRKYFLPLLLGFLVLIFSNYAYYRVSIYYPSYYKSVVINKECKLISGKVKKFRQKIQGKVTLEDFFVNDTKFVISEYDGQVGFKKTTYNNGPIKENLLVRICYVEEYPHNLILKLEIASKN